jgi:hypothetical protein
MRALPLNSTLIALVVLLVWSFARAAGSGAPATWELVGRILSRRVVLAFLLLGACFNLGFSALAGYINPRDYLQDVVAARQFLKHETMYPDDVPQLGIVELAAPIAGRDLLRRVPLVRHDLETLTEPPAPANPHPPFVGIALAAPVRLLGWRGSFVLVLLLSLALLYVSMAAILRELHPALPFAARCAMAGLVAGWYPVGTTLRSGQSGIFLLALITASWLLLRRDRPWLAGVAIGLAACIHAFPALLVLYFAVRFRRALVSAVGTVALLSAATAAVTVPSTFRQWLDTADRIAQQFVPMIGNLSWAGLITSFSSGMGWGAPVRIVAPAMMLVIAGALACYLWPWNRRHLPVGSLDVEYSVFVAAMLLASPISWGRYFPILLLPLAVLLRNWRGERPRPAVPALLGALVFLSLSDATAAWLGDGLTRHMGFAAGWLLAAMPSFSVLAILLWVGLSGPLTGGAAPESGPTLREVA